MREDLAIRFPSSPRDGAEVSESGRVEVFPQTPPPPTLTERWNIPVIGAIAAMMLRDSKGSRAWW